MKATIEAVKAAFVESADVKRKAAEALSSDILKAAAVIASAYAKGRKVILFGNGGSMADASHIAGELVGRFKLDRDGLPAIALTDPVYLTAIANDFGVDALFRRAVIAFVQPGDVAIGLSTSGNSVDVLTALSCAKDLGATAIGMTGHDGGFTMRPLCDLVFAVPSNDTPRIQECHITIGHILCDLVESELAKR